MTTGQGMPTLFAYIMTEDKGSAPNPFHGFCTLALCMPMTRGAAQVGDYVVGLAGKRLRRGGDWRFIYAMQVLEAMTFDEYWHDKRFRAKKPRGESGIRALGDSVGQPVAGTDRVLIGEKFAYWGRETKPVPASLQFLPPAFEPLEPGGWPRACGHRRIDDPEKVEAFLKWFKGQKKGCLGEPTDERKRGKVC